MYVEPIYLESASTSLPEVKKIILYYNERIAYEDTLSEALYTMFDVDLAALRGETPDQPTEEPNLAPDTPEDYDLETLAEKANTAFENALNAQRNGDWAAYGEYLDELENWLQQMLPEEVQPDMDVEPAGTDNETLPVDSQTNESILPNRNTGQR